MTTNDISYRDGNLWAFFEDAHRRDGHDHALNQKKHCGIFHGSRVFNYSYKQKEKRYNK